MKRSIKVDYESAYEEVIGSHDFHDKSPSWIKSFVDGWCDGFVEGYLVGHIETTIKFVSFMKRKGLSSEVIAKYVGVSSDTINLIG